MSHNYQMDLASFHPYLKLFHVTTVVITGSLFLLRFVWMLQGQLEQRGAWINTLPHYNDTLLFISGLAMASILGQLPMQAPWLTSKLFVLLAYILLGSLALRRGSQRWFRGMAGVAAISCYLYIIAIALSRDPTPTLQAIMSRFGMT
jgi:uncharacterized membrane protein SirB2